MTLEQQVLFDIARSHTRLALERLNETNVPLALTHLAEAQRALEILKQAAARADARPTITKQITKQISKPTIEV